MTVAPVVLPVRLGRATAAALAAAVALATSVVAAAPADASTCGPAPQGRTAVAVVVDRGDDSGPSVHCVDVATGATGAEALFAAVGQGAVRRDDPVKGPAFVCGIGGVPASGCAAVGEPYWSYWGGDPGGWTYRGIGAFGTRLRGRCAVEGWRFGAGEAPPRGGVPAVTCEVPAAPAPRPPQPAPGPAATPPAVVGGATTVPGGGGVPGGAPPAAAAGGSAATPGAEHVAGGPADPPDADGAEAPSDDGADGAQGGGPDAGTRGDASEPSPERGGGSSGAEGAAARPVVADRGDGGPGVGSIVAVLAVLLLGTAAFVRWRRGASQSSDGAG